MDLQTSPNSDSQGTINPQAGRHWLAFLMSMTCTLNFLQQEIPLTGNAVQTYIIIKIELGKP